MIDFSSFFSRSEFSDWHSTFQTAIDQRVDPKRHGDLTGWLEIVNSLPNVGSDRIVLNQDTVSIGTQGELDDATKTQLHDALCALQPWRKGPYQLFDIFINTEWRSDWKWQRVSPQISSLTGRKVLDVGCGTGYH